MKTSDFDYYLPESSIAQEPATIRDRCKMLTMNRIGGDLTDKIFSDIYDYLQPGDVLVANETRVMPARLLGHKQKTGGLAEVLLLREVHNEQHESNTQAVWETLVRPGKRLKPGVVVEFSNTQEEICLVAEILDRIDGTDKGQRLVRLSTPTHSTLNEALHAVGHTPLPPYIKNYVGNQELYQTVFSRRERSAAAPTAGLHFTIDLIKRIKEKGVSFETVELEVGLDTFRIVNENDPAHHEIHTELYTVSQHVVDAVSEARSRGNRVIAIGTTSVRSLESAWDESTASLHVKNRAATSLYLLPGSKFHVVDALVTNFHVPRSTLMMLVSAFSSREHIMTAYRHALTHDYRFLSFGDAMFISPDV